MGVMVPRDRLAEFLGVSRGFEGKAYEAVLSSLGYIVWALGLEPEDSPKVLAGLGIDVPGDIVGDIVKGVELRVGRASEEDLRAYQRDVPRFISKKYITTPRTASSISIRAASILASGLVRGRRGVSVIDPFMGGGEALREAVESIGVDAISQILGFEENPVACVVAYASLIASAGVERVYVRCEGVLRQIYRMVTTGSPIPKADLVITASPPPHIEALTSEYADLLIADLVGAGYVDVASRRVIGSASMAVLAADMMLRRHGVLSIVLPGSSLHRLPGMVARIVLRNRYRIVYAAKIPRASELPGSMGVEVVVAAVKDPGLSDTLFIDAASLERLEGLLRTAVTGSSTAVATARSVNLRRVDSYTARNWLLLFTAGERDGRLSDMFSRLVGTGRLVPLEKLVGGGGVKRGFRLVSPNFFLLPNKFWRIGRVRGGYIEIEMARGGEVLEIGKKYLEPFATFEDYMFSNIYQHRIRRYILSIPDVGPEKLDRDLVRYIEWGMRSGASRYSVNLWGSRWYSYVYRIMKSLGIPGKVVVPAAADPGIICGGIYAKLYQSWTATDEGLYSVQGFSEGFLTLWFNSTPFLAIIARLNRIVEAPWVFHDEEDYLSIPVPNVERIVDRGLIGDGSLFIRDMGDIKIPPLEEQIKERHWAREEIDRLASTYIGLREWELEFMRETLLEGLEGSCKALRTKRPSQRVGQRGTGRGLQVQGS